MSNSSEKQAHDEGLETGSSGGLSSILDNDKEAAARERGAEAKEQIDKAQEVKDEAEKSKSD